MNNINNYKKFLDYQIDPEKAKLTEAKKYIMENGDSDLTIRLSYKNKKWFIVDLKYVYSLKSPKSYYRMDMNDSFIPKDTWVIGEVVAQKDIEMTNFAKTIDELRSAKILALALKDFLETKIEQYSPKLKGPDDRDALNPMLLELAEKFGKINVRIHFA